MFIHRSQDSDFFFFQSLGVPSQIWTEGLNLVFFFFSGFERRKTPILERSKIAQTLGGTTSLIIVLEQRPFLLGNIEKNTRKVSSDLCGFQMKSLPGRPERNYQHTREKK